MNLCADGQLGEAWDSRSSPIQLVGFVLGLVGTLVYAQGTTRRGAHFPAFGPPRVPLPRHAMSWFHDLRSNPAPCAWVGMWSPIGQHLP